MVDATSIALAATANAMAAQAEHDASVAICVARMTGFTDAGASTETKRVYAQCVFDVLGSGSASAEDILFRIAVALAFIGASVTGALFWFVSKDDGIYYRACITGITAIFGGAIAMAIASAILFGVSYVFGVVK